MSAQFDAESLARISLHDSSNFNVQLSQTSHRLLLLQQWNIPAGSKILELGCGQGDCTTVLAHAVGEEGRVVAVDPAELNYGESLLLHLPALAVWVKGRGFILLQALHLLSAKPKHTSRKVLWVKELLGFSNPLWITSPPCPSLLPFRHGPLAKPKPSTLQYSPTAHGTSLPPLRSFIPFVLSRTTASASSLLSGLWWRRTPRRSLIYWLHSPKQH